MALPNAPNLSPDAASARRAAWSLVGSSMLFGLMAVAARVASRRIPGPEVALFRFALGVVAVGGVVAMGRASIRPRLWGWLLLRGLFGGLAVFAYFTCIERVGVGVATLLNYTAPVWTMLMAWWLLGERPQRSAVAALVLTVLGVVFVVGGNLGAVHAGPWALLGVFSAMASGVAVTSIRAVRRRGPDGVSAEGSWTVFASFTGLGLLATLPGVFGPLGRWVTPTPFDWVMLTAVGAFSIAAQIIMTDALEHLTGATMGIIHQLTVVFAMVCGVLFFDERLTRWTLVGSVLTVIGVGWTVLVSSRTLQEP